MKYDDIVGCGLPIKTGPRMARTVSRAREASRPASESCDCCEAPLKGRQRNFCSPKCKAAWHRERWLRALEDQVHDAVKKAFQQIQKRES